MAMGKKNRKNFKFGMVIINRNDVFLDGAIFVRPNEILALPEKKKKTYQLNYFPTMEASVSSKPGTIARFASILIGFRFVIVRKKYFLVVSYIPGRLF